MAWHAAAIGNRQAAARFRVGVAGQPGLEIVHWGVATWKDIYVEVGHIHAAAAFYHVGPSSSRISTACGHWTAETGLSGRIHTLEPPGTASSNR